MDWKHSHNLNLYRQKMSWRLLYLTSSEAGALSPILVCKFIKLDQRIYDLWVRLLRTSSNKDCNLWLSFSLYSSNSNNNKIFVIHIKPKDSVVCKLFVLSQKLIFYASYSAIFSFLNRLPIKHFMTLVYTRK